MLRNIRTACSDIILTSGINTFTRILCPRTNTNKALSKITAVQVMNYISCLHTLKHFTCTSVGKM